LIRNSDKHMNEYARAVLGIDVGGTKVMAGCVTADGIIHKQKRYAMDRSSEESIISCIGYVAEDFLRNEWEGRAPQAIGIGMFGYVDTVKGTWSCSYAGPEGVRMPIAARCEALFGVPVFMDNDVHAATLAELYLGAGLRYRDFIYLNIGTGIAAGIVCNGQLVRGAVNYAGEFGHMVGDINGGTCKCGLIGCIEPIASGGGMIAQARSKLADYPDSVLNELDRRGELYSRTIRQAAQAGDRLAGDIVERANRAFGYALAGLVNLLNPEAIIVGGGTACDEGSMDNIYAWSVERSLRIAGESIKEVAVSRFGADVVGLIGAACFAFHRLQTKPAPEKNNS